MQIQGVNNNYSSNYKLSFGTLTVKESAQKLVKQMTTLEQNEFSNLVEKLSHTKFWDLEISTIERNPNEFWCRFVNKKNPRKVYEFGVNPLEANGNMVRIYPIISQGNGDVEKIKFSSPLRAQAMIDMHKRQSQALTQRNYKSTNIQKLTMWAEQLEFLDEAYRYMKLGEIHPEAGAQAIVKKPSNFGKILKILGFDS